MVISTNPFANLAGLDDPFKVEMDRIARNGKTETERQAKFFALACKRAYELPAENLSSKELEAHPFRYPSQDMVYSTSYIYTSCLPKLKKNETYAHEHVEAGRKLLENAEYSDVLTVACQKQAAWIAQAVVATAPHKIIWQEMPRSQRINYLKQVVTATQYMMRQDDFLQDLPFFETPLIQDELDLDKKTWHRPGYLMPAAYFAPGANEITYAYYKNHDVIKHHKRAAEILSHEMSHDWSFGAKPGSELWDPKKGNLQDEHIRTIGGAILGHFERNKKYISGLKAQKNETLSQLYYAWVEERNAYECNDVFNEEYDGVTLEILSGFRDDLKGGPSTNSWLIDGITEKLRQADSLGFYETDCVSDVNRVYSVIEESKLSLSKNADPTQVLEDVFKRARRMRY